MLLLEDSVYNVAIRRFCLVKIKKNYKKNNDLSSKNYIYLCFNSQIIFPVYRIFIPIESYNIPFKRGFKYM